MESLQNIKRRLKGVQNINQITKAMELVAATKMRRSQEIALASRPYAYAALELLANLSKLDGVHLPKIMEKRPIRRTAFVLIASDKGLAGSFNSAVLRKFEKYLAREKLDLGNPDYSFIAIGEKAARHLQKRIGRVSQKFIRFGDFTTVEQVKPLRDLLVCGYLEETWDRVIIFSTHFRSALKQEVLQREILPVDFDVLRATAKELVPETGKFAELLRSNGVSFFNGTSGTKQEYLIEPSPETVLQELIPHLVEMQLYHLVLEANASEHAARRVAMKSASENAGELGEKLTVDYNKIRQATITRELIEITAGAESLQ